jgi:hypothetical protein
VTQESDGPDPNPQDMPRLFPPMRTTPRRALAAALLATASATATVALPAASATRLAQPPLKVTTAVVGLLDTGINPYHAVFRDRSVRAYRYPGTYLPTYPKNAIALNLHLDAKDYASAVRADCKQWAKVRPGQLYWVPGTRIVGAISFSPAGRVDCGVEDPGGMPILDAEGHGTMTASRAGGAGYGGCRTCLVVSAQFPTSVSIGTDAGDSTKTAIQGIKWLAANASWIDAQSNSWGPVAPVYDPTGQAGLLAANAELDKAVEEVSRVHLAFWASGNGAAFRYGILGHPTLLAPHLGPSAMIVGGDDSGYVATWPGFTPTVVSDACASWAAKIGTMSDSADTVGSGTSAATPYAAGGAAAILADARTLLGDARTGVRGGVVAKGRAGIVKTGPLADGVLTLAEWRDLVVKTATRRPVKQYEDGPPCDALNGGTGIYDATPVQWSQVPDQFPEYLLIGYGAVDRPSIALAGKVLRGTAPLPDRADADRYFAADRQVRETTGKVFGR